MDLNLDAVIAAFKPWDFSITIDGKGYPTKPLTLHDREILSGVVTVAQLRKVIPTLFENAPPGTDSWEETKLLAVFHAMAAYRAELAAKNARAVGTMVSTAMNPAR